MENKGIILIWIIIIVAVTLWMLPFIIELESMEKVEHTGIVTDKWSEYTIFFTFGSNKYILEIDNEFTKEVTHFEYRNIEINETFYYTKWENVK